MCLLISEFFFFLSREEIQFLRWLWEGNVRERISFQTWHTPVNIRTKIKAAPLPTAVHPQQIWQSAPIVWPWPITDNGSPPEPPLPLPHLITPRRPNWPCSDESRGTLMNTRDMTCQLSSTVTASDRLGARRRFSYVSVSPVKNGPSKSAQRVLQVHYKPSLFIQITPLLQTCFYYIMWIWRTSK